MLDKLAMKGLHPELTHNVARNNNIALARLLDVNGNIINVALILNVNGIAVSDENGYLQAEIDHGTSHFEVSKGNFHCEANFSNPESSDLIVQLGTLQCL